VIGAPPRRPERLRTAVELEPGASRPAGRRGPAIPRRHDRFFGPSRKPRGVVADSRPALRGSSSSGSGPPGPNGSSLDRDPEGGSPTEATAQALDLVAQRPSSTTIPSASTPQYRRERSPRSIPMVMCPCSLGFVVMVILPAGRFSVDSTLSGDGMRRPFSTRYSRGYPQDARDGRLNSGADRPSGETPPRGRGGIAPSVSN